MIVEARRDPRRELLLALLGRDHHVEELLVRALDEVRQRLARRRDVRARAACRARRPWRAGSGRSRRRTARRCRARRGRGRGASARRGRRPSGRRSGPSPCGAPRSGRSACFLLRSILARSMCSRGPPAPPGCRRRCASGCACTRRRPRGPVGVIADGFLEDDATARRDDEEHLLAVVRRDAFGRRCGPSTTLGMPSARASSCTCESTLPSPCVRMPAAGRGRPASRAGRRSRRACSAPSFGATRRRPSARPGVEGAHVGVDLGAEEIVRMRSLTRRRSRRGGAPPGRRAAAASRAGCRRGCRRSAAARASTAPSTSAKASIGVGLRPLDHALGLPAASRVNVGARLVAAAASSSRSAPAAASRSRAPSRPTP